MTAFAEAFIKENPGRGREPDIICIDGKAMRGTVQYGGRTPDIVSAYSRNTGITLATEACREKSNEIKAVPLLLGKLDLAGHVATADAMSMQKDIIDLIRGKGGDFIIELKANQPSLRYGIEDRIGLSRPIQTYTQGPVLAHGRIETRTYRTYHGLELIADKEKWGGALTVIEFEADTVKKSSGVRTREKRLYVSSLEAEAERLGRIIRSHWSIESMHWLLDYNLGQDRIKRKAVKAARNLDSIQLVVHALFSMWRYRRRKLSDKAKGMAELMRNCSLSFTWMLRFLKQK